MPLGKLWFVSNICANLSQIMFGPTDPANRGLQFKTNSTLSLAFTYNVHIYIYIYL